MMLTAPARRRTQSPVLTSCFRSANALLLLVVLSAPTAAQILYATMTGTVTDSSGAVLPGTTVQATNVETGVAKTTIADQGGGFLFSDLVPGVYDVTFQIQGFKRVVQRAVRVDTNAARRVEVRLEIS